jgi:hypothetical protein
MGEWGMDDLHNALTFTYLHLPTQSWASFAYLIEGFVWDSMKILTWLQQVTSRRCEWYEISRDGIPACYLLQYRNMQLEISSWHGLIRGKFSYAFIFHY